jgi:hypothetical protein
LGAIEPAVVAVQLALIAGGTANSADTETAIKTFQATSRLKSSGEVDPWKGGCIVRKRSANDGDREFQNCHGSGVSER